MSKAYMLAHAGKCVKISDDGLSFEAVDCGDSVSIPDTSYANNTDAVTDLGIGKLYKSDQQINGSPIILITI